MDNRDKQIEEMFLDVVKAFNYARDFCTEQGGCDICENRKYGRNCDFASMAEHLYNKGYRKASEVAEVHCTDCKHFVGCERVCHGVCDSYEVAR